MKKSLIFLLGLAMMLFMAACGDDGESDAANDGDNGDGESQESYELEFGMQPNNQSNEYEAAEHLQEYVKDKSDGRLTISLYPDAQLGDDLDMLGQLQEGSLDITLSEMGRLGEWVPRSELLAVPYVMDDFDHIKRFVYDTDAGQKLRDELVDEHGLRVIDSAYNGTRVTSSNTEINSVSDMEGLKIRVPEADTLIDYAKATGADPTPMNFDEVYLALQTNQVDGEENPLSAIKAKSFHEVQDYIALTNHVVNDNSYVVSEKTWEKLPEDLQQILKEGIQDTADYHTKMFEDEEDELLDFFKDKGVTITKPDLDEFRDAVSDVYPKYMDEIGEGAEDFMDAIDKARD
ncbi:sialic acid TRAP transporter substrate-binding protein SiaP [Barrientosiimonas marina]|uniref:Sialic acid TRAP transporter substrate-binding protein SiaP n=1 Tax=Lentibacillus kimchii TaxID=1542911 RepID=A0ABW2UT94_9BACI